MEVRDKVNIGTNSFVLTIDDERYEFQQNVFKHYGLPCPEKFRGLTGEPDGSQACLIGHLSLIMMARTLDLPYIVVFEEDAYPRKDIKEKLDHYLSIIPKTAGIVCLGENGHRGMTEKNGEFVIVKERPFGSHAYICFKEAYDDFIRSMEKQRIVDIALKSNNFLKYKPHWTEETLFIQKNINTMNMTSKSGVSNKKYFYPHPKNKDLYFSDVPPEEFEDSIDGIFEIKRIYVDNGNSWKSICIFDEQKNKFWHGKDESSMVKIKDNVWKLDWVRWPLANEYLVFEDSKYKIIKNYSE